MDVRGQRQSFDPSALELVVTVPYEANTFVMFVNSAHSIHAVRALAQPAQWSTNASLRSSTHGGALAWGLSRTPESSHEQAERTS